MAGLNPSNAAKLVRGCSMGNQFARRSQVHCALRRIGCALPIERFFLLAVIGRARGAGRSCCGANAPCTGPPSRVVGSHSRRPSRYSARASGVSPRSNVAAQSTRAVARTVWRARCPANETSARKRASLLEKNPPARQRTASRELRGQPLCRRSLARPRNQSDL
jgi:hypothetical protein